MLIDTNHKFVVSNLTRDILDKYKGWYFCTDRNLAYFSDKKLDWLILGQDKELNVVDVRVIMRRKTTLKGIDPYLKGTVDELLSMLDVVDIKEEQ